MASTEPASRSAPGSVSSPSLKIEWRRMSGAAHASLFVDPAEWPIMGDYDFLLPPDLIQRLSQSLRLLTPRIQAGDTEANPVSKGQDILLAVFILDLHLGSRDRQSLDRKSTRLNSSHT